MTSQDTPVRRCDVVCHHFAGALGPALLALRP